MRHRLIHPIKIIIQQQKSAELVNKVKEQSNSKVLDSITKYKLISFGLSGLLAVSESLPFMSDIKSNGLIHIIQDLIKESNKQTQN